MINSLEFIVPRVNYKNRQFFGQDDKYEKNKIPQDGREIKTSKKGGGTAKTRNMNF